MSVICENTLVIDFSVLPKRPDANAVEKFLYNKLKLELADVINLQFHNVRNVVFVEMINEETAWKYRNNHHLKHAMKVGEKDFNIPVYVEDDAVNVRVHDLPPRLPNTVLKEHLQPFGDILSINREVWKKHFPGVHNGVRVVRMRLAKAIPSYQTIGGETTLVTYRNQQKTCKFCGRKSHPRQKCTPNHTSTPAKSSNSAPLSATDFPALEQQKQQQKQNKQQKLQPQQQQQQKIKTTQHTQQEKTNNNSDVERMDSDSDSDSSEALTTNTKRRLSTKSVENEQKRIAFDFPVYQTDTQEFETNADENKNTASDGFSLVKSKTKNKKDKLDKL